jgi:hypothetical protein
LEFFPNNAFEDYPGGHVFRVNWYVPHLLSMAEQPLYPPVADQAAICRLLFLPTFHRPVVVRLIEADGTWRVVCKRTNGRGGYRPGPLINEETRGLSSVEAKQFAVYLSQVELWDMPSIGDREGLDGSQAVLEAVCEGRYHVVDRWSPQGTPYAQLVDFLLALCTG